MGEFPKDMQGSMIRPGDRIAVAFRRGYSAAIEVREVIRAGPEGLCFRQTNGREQDMAAGAARCRTLRLP